ncbi:MAG: hypothetical protein ABI780_14900, partial [Ardenticatenales bacterium]
KQGGLLNRRHFVAIIMFALVVYWYCLANRYAIFLYGHVDHIGDPPAQPFDALTTTRYVMASFAAAGFGATGELLRNLIPRSASDVNRGAGWKAIAPTVIVLVVATFFVASRANTPSLPLPLALIVAAASGLGYCMAMWWLHTVGGDGSRLLWLIADGTAPAMVILGWRIVEVPERGVAKPIAMVAATAVLLGAVGCRRLVRGLRGRVRNAPLPSPMRSQMAGACLVLLGFPMLHYVHTFAGYPYMYITAAQNVGGYHVITWLQATVLAVALTTIG